MSETVEINLVQTETRTRVGPVDAEQISTMPVPSADPRRDGEIEKSLEEAAVSAGLTFERKNAGSVHHPQTPHWGGMATVHSVTETIRLAGPYVIYAGSAAAGAAVFLRNALGIVVEWQKLRDRRSVEIVVRGEKVQVKDGATAEQVLKDIQTALNSSA